VNHETDFDCPRSDVGVVMTAPAAAQVPESASETTSAVEAAKPVKVDSIAVKVNDEKVRSLPIAEPQKAATA
jgi:hypothetical protein